MNIRSALAIFVYMPHGVSNWNIFCTEMKIIIAVRFEYVILACLFLFMFFSSVSKYYPGLWGRHRRSMWSTAFNYKYVYFYEYVKYVKFEVI